MPAPVRIVASHVLRQGIYVTSMTPAARLAALAARLGPVLTDFPLIRIGAANDGGYLVPDDMAGIACCFSPGVGDLAAFESHLLRDYGIPSHLADGSVDAVPVGAAVASFTRRFIGVVDGERSMTLDAWVNSRPEAAAPHDLLLQMDIEGGEYAALMATSPEVLRRFRIVVVELHGLEALGCPAFCGVVESLLDRLLPLFHVVHAHVNNNSPVVSLRTLAVPPTLELTLLRKDRSPARGPCTRFPHPLDASNREGSPDVVLPPGWRATTADASARS